MNKNNYNSPISLLKRFTLHKKYHKLDRMFRINGKNDTYAEDSSVYNKIINNNYIIIVKIKFNNRRGT